MDGQIMMACHNNNMNSYLNHCTVDGNSAVMWASWSGSLDVCQLLVSRGADVVNVTNRNGCTVAHWAASGGNVQVCRYLYDIGVDFSLANHGGNTPLTHAVAFGRSEVVE
jgi:ankyrin repeat protein